MKPGEPSKEKRRPRTSFADSALERRDLAGAGELKEAWSAFMETAVRVLGLGAGSVSNFQGRSLTALKLVLRLLQDTTSDAAGATSSGPVDGLDAKIETLYRRLDALTQRHGATRDSQIQNQITQTLDELRQLQTMEAVRFREQFEASLATPVDAGAQILDRSRTLRKKLEGLAASHSASR